MKITGKYTEARIFNDYVEESAISQIYGIVNEKAYEDQTIRLCLTLIAEKVL